MVFACPFGPSRNVRRIDKTPELRQVRSPPLIHARYSSPIGRGHSFRHVTSSSPVAIKRVHAVRHLDSRIHKSGSGQTVFGLKIDAGSHTLCLGRFEPGSLISLQFFIRIFQEGLPRHFSLYPPFQRIRSTGR